MAAAHPTVSRALETCPGCGRPLGQTHRCRGRQHKVSSRRPDWFDDQVREIRAARESAQVAPVQTELAFTEPVTPPPAPALADTPPWRARVGDRFEVTHPCARAVSGSHRTTLVVHNVVDLDDGGQLVVTADCAGDRLKVRVLPDGHLRPLVLPPRGPDPSP